MWRDFSDVRSQLGLGHVKWKGGGRVGEGWGEGGGWGEGLSDHEQPQLGAWKLQCHGVELIGAGAHWASPWTLGFAKVPGSEVRGQLKPCPLL